MEEVEGAKDENVAKYSASLESGVETILKEVTDIRNEAQHEMILAEDSEHDKVVAFLTGLRDAVASLQAEATRINKYQCLFKVRHARVPNCQCCSCPMCTYMCSSAWLHCEYPSREYAGMPDAKSTRCTCAFICCTSPGPSLAVCTCSCKSPPLSRWVTPVRRWLSSWHSGRARPSGRAYVTRGVTHTLTAWM